MTMQRRRALQHAYYPGSVAWHPRKLGPLLVAWWAADDLAAASVTSWVDRILGSNTTAASTAIPTWSATSWQGNKAGVTFDGVANGMTVAPVTTGIPLGSTAGEVWAVATNTSATVAYKSLIRYGGAAAAVDRLVYANIDARQSPLVGDGTTNVIGTASTPAMTSAGFIIGANWAGTTEGGRHNGQDFQPNATATIAALNTNTPRLRIGSSNFAAASHFWTGQIRHVIITLLLAPAQRQLLEGWLAWDGWPSGPASPLPANHPYKFIKVA